MNFFNEPKEITPLIISFIYEYDDAEDIVVSMTNINRVNTLFHSLIKEKYDTPKKFVELINLLRSKDDYPSSEEYANKFTTEISKAYLKYNDEFSYYIGSGYEHNIKEFYDKYSDYIDINYSFQDKNICGQLLLDRYTSNFEMAKHNAIRENIRALEILKFLIEKGMKLYTRVHLHKGVFNCAIGAEAIGSYPIEVQKLLGTFKTFELMQQSRSLTTIGVITDHIV